jgi:hypothetical protein
MNKQILEQIATAAAPRKKGTKANTFIALLDIISGSYSDNLDIKLDQDTLEMFADLYAFFAPALPTTPKTCAQWVAQALNQKLIRENCKYMKGDGPLLVATDGHRLHMATYNDKLWAHGFYDHKGQVVRHNATFPDYQRVIPTTTTPIILPDLFPATFFGGIHAYKIGNYWYQKRFVDEAMAGCEAPHAGENEGKLVIEGTGPAGQQLKAIIMPLDMKTYIDQGGES